MKWWAAFKKTKENHRSSNASMVFVVLFIDYAIKGNLDFSLPLCMALTVMLYAEYIKAPGSLIKTDR